jgi:hypothetical protein
MEDSGSNDFDDLMDSLPAKTRKQVLSDLGVGIDSEATTIGADVESTDTRQKGWSLTKQFMWWTAATMAFMWAVPWVLVTIVLFVTIAGIPIGLLTWAIGSAPLALLIEKKIKADTLRGAKRSK